MDELERRLEETIENQFDSIETLSTINSDEEQMAIKNLEVLYRIKQENDKVKDQKNVNRIQVGIGIGTSLLGLLVYIYCFNVGLAFEETGAIGSTFFRNHLSKKLKL